jgi:hypothetical protein
MGHRRPQPGRPAGRSSRRPVRRPVDPGGWLDPDGYRPAGRRRPGTRRRGVLATAAIVLCALVLLVNAVQPMLEDLTREPAHIAGPRRLPPHRVRAVTRPGVWSELEFTDGPIGAYEGQWVHAVRGYLYVKGRRLCARPLLYLNGRLWIRGYWRCGRERLWFIAWSSTREMQWYGPKGAVFELVWTDPWSRAHPRYKWQ